jgi:endoglucanase
MSVESSELALAALSRPLVRVNQLGYVRVGPKRATLIRDEPTSTPFAVRDADGVSVFEGWTVRHSDRAAFATHVVDFSEVTTVGDRFTVECGDACSHPFAIADDLYRPLFEDALGFFYPQRSGIEISDERARGYGRPAGHVGVAPNRGDTAVTRWLGRDADALYPGWRFDCTVDVSGGWYDAGDHGKYVVCGGLSASMLLATFERLARLDVAGADAVLEEAMWEVDWILSMQVAPGEQHAGLAFHRVHDDHWTPLPLQPHHDSALRVLHRPSTAAGLNLAAVCAHAARCVPRRLDELLAAAIAAYDAARREPDLYAPADNGAHGGGSYDDANLTDEFYWAATELFLTTGHDRFRDDLIASSSHYDDVFDTDGFDWDSVAPFARLELAVHTNDFDGTNGVRQSVIDAADRLAEMQDRLAWGQPYAPTNGWDWGSNGRILSNLIVLATAADLTGSRRHCDAYLTGLDYLLGRNPVGMSFITGYGTDHSHRQRVRHFGHALDPTYPPPPPGSLAGGPASKTYDGFPGDPRFVELPDQLCYVDEPTSETTNDICIRWNAALVQATAFALESPRRLGSGGTTRSSTRPPAG